MYLPQFGHSNIYQIKNDHACLTVAYIFFFLSSLALKHSGVEPKCCTACVYTTRSWTTIEKKIGGNTRACAPGCDADFFSPQLRESTMCIGISHCREPATITFYVRYKHYLHGSNEWLWLREWERCECMLGPGLLLADGLVDDEGACAHAFAGECVCIMRYLPSPASRRKHTFCWV